MGHSGSLELGVQIMWDRLLCGCAVLIAIHGGPSRNEAVEIDHPSVTGQTRAASASDRSRSASMAPGDTKAARVILADEIPEDQLKPLPPNARIVRHYAGAIRAASASDRSNRQTSITDEKLIYSNTRGSHIYRPPIVGLRIADDIFTEAVDYCEL